MKDLYDASKEAHNQQLQVRVLGSSIKLSLLSRRTSKVLLPCLKPRTNRDKKSENGRFDSILTRADHIQHVIACEQPIGILSERAHLSTLLLMGFLIYQLCTSHVLI